MYDLRVSRADHLRPGSEPIRRAHGSWPLGHVHGHVMCAFTDIVRHGRRVPRDGGVGEIFVSFNEHKERAVSRRGMHDATRRRDRAQRTKIERMSFTPCTSLETWPCRCDSLARG